MLLVQASESSDSIDLDPFRKNASDRLPAEMGPSFSLTCTSMFARLDADNGAHSHIQVSFGLIHSRSRRPSLAQVSALALLVVLIRFTVELGG
jgi:hypothetical protein